MSTTKTPDRAGMFVCKLCGRGFTRKQGLGRHMNETHGTSTTRSKSSAKSKPAQPVSAQQAATNGATNGAATASVREQLRQLAEPLTVQRAEIDRRLAELAAEATQLRADRSDIDAVLKRLDPTTQTQTTSRAGISQAGNQARAQRLRHERVATLRDYIERHADELREGFTVTQLTEAVKADGGLAMTTTTAMPAIDELRNAGLVRADRVTRGGGMRYQLVTNGGGSNG